MICASNDRANESTPFSAGMCQFHDLDYVLRRVAGDDRVNVLALIQNPTDADLGSFTDTRFVFRGFDLVDLQTGISALVNCGGFDKAFASTELSDCGLLTDHSRALSVQKGLKAEYPDEHHANCDVWAIWQLKQGQNSSENDNE